MALLETKDVFKIVVNYLEPFDFFIWLSTIGLDSDKLFIIQIMSLHANQFNTDEALFLGKSYELLNHNNLQLGNIYDIKWTFDRSILRYPCILKQLKTENCFDALKRARQSWSKDEYLQLASQMIWSKSDIDNEIIECRNIDYLKPLLNIFQHIDVFEFSSDSRIQFIRDDVARYLLEQDKIRIHISRSHMQKFPTRLSVPIFSNVSIYQFLIAKYVDTTPLRRHFFNNVSLCYCPDYEKTARCAFFLMQQFSLEIKNVELACCIMEGMDYSPECDWLNKKLQLYFMKEKLGWFLNRSSHLVFTRFYLWKNLPKRKQRNHIILKTMPAPVHLYVYAKLLYKYARKHFKRTRFINLAIENQDIPLFT